MGSYPIEIRRCRHIRTNGTQCGSPALRDKEFCYYHEQNQPRAEELYVDGYRYPDSQFMLPVFEDAHSIQTALRQVIQLLFEHRIHHKDAGLMLYALQIASGNLKRMDAEKAKPTQMVVDPEKTGETPLGMTPWSASGQGHDPEEEDESLQHSTPSPFGSGQAKSSHQLSGRPERNVGDDADGNEGEFGDPRVSNAARAGASAQGQSGGGGAARSSGSEMSQAERERILRAVHGYWPEEFEFRAPFSYLKVKPEQPLCPKCLAKRSIVEMGEAGEGCEPGYRRCPDCKWTAEEARGDGGEVASENGVVQ